jgi:uncharacterized protein YbjT (DUF2867 family)
MEHLGIRRLAEAMTTHLIIGGTGKTGRRVLENLTSRGLEVRPLSRPEFDWEDQGTWSSFEGRVDSAYITFAPDVAFPGAPEAVAEVTRRALASGVGRVVLLTGRGEPEAQRAERLVADLAAEYGAEWAVVRCAVFMQNFSESFFADSLAAGHFAFPADTVREPFVDVDDIASVVTGLMVGEVPGGRVYELTGPRLMTFAEATATIAAVAERPISYTAITIPEFVDELVSAGLPVDDAHGLGALFAEILDGHNAQLADGVREALGREPRDFADYVRDAAATGCWNRVQADA